MLLGQFRVRQHGSRNASRNGASGSQPVARSTNTQVGSPPAQAAQGSSDLRNRLGASTLERARTSAQSETLRDSTDAQFDEPISQTVSRRRHRSDCSNLELSDQDRKRLKVEARELARSTGLSSSQKLLQLTEAKDVASMILTLGAWVLRQQEKKEEDETSEESLCLRLMSKNFELSLRSRLTVCLLSPNITAYVTDTHPNIMSFIKAHTTLFKVPEQAFEKAEPCSLLSRMVSKDLSTIRGNFKVAISESISKRKNITDAFQSVVGTKSIIGIEVGTNHWTRLAFLRRCYREFFIGVGSDKTLIDHLFSMYLIPGLHRDLRSRVEGALSIDLEELEEELRDRLDWNVDGGVDDEDPPRLDSDDSLDVTCGTAGVGRISDDDPGNGESGHHSDAQNAEGNQGLSGSESWDNEAEHATQPSGSTTEQSDAEPEPESGFLRGRDGSPPKYTDGKFWNYVDDSLERLRRRARKEAGGRGRDVELELYARTLNEILTLDLQEFPSQRRLDKIADIAPPEWQQTIEQNLIWVPTQVDE